MLLSPMVFSKINIGKWMLNGIYIVCLIMVLQINSVNRIMIWFCLYFYGLISFLNGLAVNAAVNLMEKKSYNFSYQFRLAFIYCILKILHNLRPIVGAFVTRANILREIWLYISFNQGHTDDIHIMSLGREDPYLI
jgi:hypothetical protein